MAEYLVIGSSPCEETCAQVGEPNYRRKASQECLMFIKAIRKVCGDPPKGARLHTKSFLHDFGVYHEVVCSYENEKGAAYAYKCEAEAPQTWEEGGIRRDADGSFHFNITLPDGIDGFVSDWTFSREGNELTIIGNIYNDKKGRFVDGDYIHLSAVVSVDMTTRIVTTKNSKYLLV